MATKCAYCGADLCYSNQPCYYCGSEILQSMTCGGMVPGTIYSVSDNPSKPPYKGDFYREGNPEPEDYSKKLF